MELRKHIFRLVILSTAATLGLGVAVYHSATYKEADAYSISGLPTTIDLNDCSEETIRSYYSSLNSKDVSERQGTNLLKNLKTILKNGQQYYSYDESNNNKIWQIYEISDRDWEKSPASSITSGTYNSTTNKITNYTYNSDNPYIHALYVNENVDNQTRAWGDHGNSSAWGMNREHIWAKSHGFHADGNGGARGDLMHLWAANGYANNIHSNNFYGFVDRNRTYTDCGDKYNNISNNLSGFSKNAGGGEKIFEPQDCDKGDIARSIFYMAARYNYYSGSDSDGISTNNPNLFLANDLSENSRASGTSTATDPYAMGLLSDLLAWNKLDPVDEYEIHRNNILYLNYTKNRNPFIDFPEWADVIWGTANLDGTNYSSSINGYAKPLTDAISSSTVTPTFGISSNSLSLRVNETATISANNANTTITWTVGNSSIVSLNKTSTTNNEDVTITALATGTTTITATSGGNSATCTVTVSNFGTEQNPLAITEAIELIDDAGSSMTAQPIYVKGIVSSSSAFNTQYNNYDEIWLESEDGQTPQAFELFRAKVDTTKVSGDYTAEDAFKDKEVVAYGYAKKHNSTYELCTSDSNPRNPLIVAVRAPVATGITLDRETAEIEVGGTVTLTAALTPSGSESTYTWTSSNESVATVDDGVVTGVSAGTAVITATVANGIEAECTVTVTGGSSQTVLQLASSITAGDTVFLTCNELSKQYNGPSSGNASAYGTYVDYDGSEPSTDGLSLEVCNGSDPTTYAFKLKLGDYVNKYLAWSSENTLKVAPSIDDNSSWTVSFDASKNATIANVADNNRVIWWNAGSPRFSCYTNKTNGNSYKYVQLWKLVGEAELTPNDYLGNTQGIKTITGRETINDNGTTGGSIAFANLNLNNGAQYTTPFNGSGFTVQFAGGENDGKYYDTGSGIRTYGGGTITIASTGTISQITLTWDGSNKPSSSSVVDSGTYNTSTGVWTGSASSVVFTRPSGSGHWRLKSVSVICSGQTIVVDQVALRFGGMIPVEDWTTINESWEITDYGIVFARGSMLEARELLTAEAVFRNDEDDTYKVHKETFSTPKTYQGNYLFTARLSLEEEDYDEVFYAAPYIFAGGQYYFFKEMHCSVRSIAEECLTTHDTTLSEAALRTLR